MLNKFDISSFVDIDTENSVCDGLVTRFKKRRKELKLSQKQISVLSGVSYASVRRFENTGEISLKSLLKLAGAIDSLSDFSTVFAYSKAKNLKDMI